MQPNDRPLAQAPPHVSNGAYYIKSKIADVYLTCPQDPADMVSVQQSDPYSNSQSVRRYLLG